MPSIFNKGGKIQFRSGLMIEPGLNEIEQGAWDLAKPQAGLYLERGLLRVESEAPSADESPESPSISLDDEPKRKRRRKRGP